MPILNPDKIKIGYVILAAVPKPVVSRVQRMAGYGVSSKWTHVAGSLGGIVEHILPADFDNKELFEEVEVGGSGGP